VTAGLVVLYSSLVFSTLHSDSLDCGGNTGNCRYVIGCCYIRLHCGYVLCDDMWIYSVCSY